MTDCSGCAMRRPAARFSSQSRHGRRYQYRPPMHATAFPTFVPPQLPPGSTQDSSAVSLPDLVKIARESRPEWRCFRLPGRKNNHPDLIFGQQHPAPELCRKEDRRVSSIGSFLPYRPAMSSLASISRSQSLTKSEWKTTGSPTLYGLDRRHAFIRCHIPKTADIKKF